MRRMYTDNQIKNISKPVAKKIATISASSKMGNSLTFKVTSELEKIRKLNSGLVLAFYTDSGYVYWRGKFVSTNFNALDFINSEPIELVNGQYFHVVGNFGGFTDSEWTIYFEETLPESVDIKNLKADVYIF